MDAEQYDSLYALNFSLGFMILFSLAWIAGHQR